MGSNHVDYSTARASWRIIRTKRKNGSVTEQWQVTLYFKVEDGVDEQGRTLYRDRRKSKLFPSNELPIDATERKKGMALRAWRKELMDAQKRAEDYQAKQEAIATAERIKREEAEAEAAMPKIYDYAIRFIDSLSKSESVSLRTIDDYATAAKRLRCFAATPINKLTREDIQRWINQLNETYAPVTVRKSAQFLKRILEEAVDDELIPTNPAATKKIKLPRNRTKRDKNSIALDDRAKVASLLRSKCQTPYVTAALIAMETGLREGEISALRWRDVNLDTMSVTIHHGISRHSHGSEYTHTKREASDRTIPINKPLEDILQSRKATMLKECMKAGVPTDVKSFSLLFVIGDVEGNYYEPSQISRNWKVIAEIEGLVGIMGERLTFHDLRHSYASAALAKGGDLMSVASNLGHSDPSITAKTYAIADPAAKRRTADLVGETTMQAVGEIVEFQRSGTEG